VKHLSGLDVQFKLRIFKEYSTISKLKAPSSIQLTSLAKGKHKPPCKYAHIHVRLHMLACIDRYIHTYIHTYMELSLCFDY